MLVSQELRRRDCKSWKRIEERNELKALLIDTSNDERDVLGQCTQAG